MNLLFQNFCYICIIGSVINALLLKHRSKKYIAESPKLKEGYKVYYRGILIYCNIPWAVMAFGKLTRLTVDTQYYFYPSNLKPVVILFHLSLVYMWIHASVWIYFKNGAEFIEKHPGMISLKARWIRILFTILLLTTIISMFIMWTSEMPAV